MIEVDDIAVSLGGVEVLGGVSLSVAEGEFVALVGPNGAGKTTLLRTINGVVTPDRGSVAVDGRPLAACSAREVGRLVATVPQDASVGFDFDVREVVAMGRTPHHPRFGADPDGPAAVDRALERTDTDALADRPIGAVSGGERQRVLLARALAQETPALLLDEPTASLDINHQVRTLELVRELVDEGRTALAAIHDLDLAARYCDRIALLVDGAFVAVGDPASVLTAENLEAAFGTRAAVATDPATGTPRVTALPDLPGPVVDLRVHVLGSGEAAARTIAALAGAGLSVTAGPLARGDFARRTAAAHGVETVEVPPLSPVGDPERTAALERVRAADVTVLAGDFEGSATLDLADESERLVVVAEGPDDAVDVDDSGADGLPERFARRARVVAPREVVGAAIAAAGERDSSAKIEG